ncbi:MAG: hypothetical protein EON49_05880 [Acidovorax sp.]|nr:MAG: hypothetical protein EON49_05880 [Acidovorax sp.]
MQKITILVQRTNCRPGPHVAAHHCRDLQGLNIKIDSKESIHIKRHGLKELEEAQHQQLA